MARLLAIGLSDKLRQWMGLPPVYVPLALPMSQAKNRLVVLPLQVGGWQGRREAAVVGVENEVWGVHWHVGCWVG
jgi:hypothetical protein